MRRITENEYNAIRLYQPGTSTNSPRDSRQVKIVLDEEEDKDKPDFTKMFDSALANIPVG